MQRTIRFHLDENCDRVIATGLRLRGVDVTTTEEANLKGAGDLAHIVHALAQGRILLTHDPDFVALHHAGVSHAGIFYCHQSKYPPGGIIRLVILAWDLSEPDEYRDRLEYI